jgi:uncharacterized membrane protein
MSWSLASIVVRLQSTYWFLPSVVTAMALILGVVLTSIDRAYSDSTSWLGWAYGGGADGARALLSAVAGSVITVVSVTFSVMVVALTVSSQHFGPRLLNSFMRDRVSQLVLGTFTGTFAYCLIVLRTIQGDGPQQQAFVPHLATTAGLALTLFGVGVLIYYVHHVATSMLVSSITASVAADLEGAIERLYPERVGRGIEPPSVPAPPAPRDAMAVTATTMTGYLQEIDSHSVLALATDADTTVWLVTRPGVFIITGQTIALVHPAPGDPEAFSQRLLRSFALGANRTSRQDVTFPAQQLVEVALRALSPSTNEPFTALTCIDRLEQGLHKLAARELPSAVRKDRQNRVRLIAEPHTFADVLTDTFEPIALYADRTPTIAHRLMTALVRLVASTFRPEDREAIGRIAGFVRTVAKDQLKDDEHRRQIDRRFVEVRLLVEEQQRSRDPHTIRRSDRG